LIFSTNRGLGIEGREGIRTEEGAMRWYDGEEGELGAEN
jgi:hypothetical protein